SNPPSPLERNSHEDLHLLHDGHADRRLPRAPDRHRRGVCDLRDERAGLADGRDWVERVRRRWRLVVDEVAGDAFNPMRRLTMQNGSIRRLSAGWLDDDVK